MDIKESRHDNVVLLELSGSVDTRATRELERAVTDLLDKGDRLIGIGFKDVDELTGSGLRVLVMLAKNLAGLDGGLVLYSMSAPVKTIFDVSGLTSLFGIVPTKKEALQQLSSPKRMSKLSLLATKILDGGKEEDPQAKREEPSSRRRGSRLSKQVVRLLSTEVESQDKPAASEDDDIVPTKTDSATD